MKTHLASMVFAIVGLVSAPAAAQQPLAASLSFVSESGDYIGQGQSQWFTLDTASISVRSGQDGGSFGLTVFPFAGGFWFLDLAAPQGSRLVPGTYEGAVRYPFQSSIEPGLSLSGDGRGCNTLTGRFTVIEARFGPNGYIERFHATFEQHCEGAIAALFGEVELINPPPPAILQISLTTDGVGRVERMSGRVTLTGTLSCTVHANVSINAVLAQRLSRFALATAGASRSVPCTPTTTAWALELVPTGEVPFGQGMARAELQATAFDPNYGTFANVAKVYAVKLHPSR